MTLYHLHIICAGEPNQGQLPEGHHLDSVRDCYSGEPSQGKDQKSHWEVEQPDSSLPRSQGSWFVQSPILQNQYCIKLKEKIKATFEKQRQKLSLCYTQENSSLLQEAEEFCLGEGKQGYCTTQPAVWGLNKTRGPTLKIFEGSGKRRLTTFPNESILIPWSLSMRISERDLVIQELWINIVLLGEG